MNAKHAFSKTERKLNFFLPLRIFLPNLTKKRKQKLDYVNFLARVRPFSPKA